MSKTPKQKSKRIYLNESEIKVLSMALMSYNDYCGEVIADYKDSLNNGFVPSEIETQEYNESLERRTTILQIYRKLH